MPESRWLRFVLRPALDIWTCRWNAIIWRLKWHAWRPLQSLGVWKKALTSTLTSSQLPEAMECAVHTSILATLRAGWNSSREGWLRHRHLRQGLGWFHPTRQIFGPFKCHKTIYIKYDMIWSCQDKDPSAGPSFHLVFGKPCKASFQMFLNPTELLMNRLQGGRQRPSTSLSLRAVVRLGSVEHSAKVRIVGNQDAWMMGWKVKGEPVAKYWAILGHIGPKARKRMGWLDVSIYRLLWNSVWFFIPCLGWGWWPPSFQSFNWATWNHVEPPWSYNDLLRTVGSPNWHCRTLWTVVRSILRTTTGPPNSPWSLVRCASTPGMAHHLPPRHWAWPKNWEFLDVFRCDLERRYLRPAVTCAHVCLTSL